MILAQIRTVYRYVHTKRFIHTISEHC